jgi:hypothetical protein
MKKITFLMLLLPMIGAAQTSTKTIGAYTLGGGAVMTLAAVTTTNETVATTGKPKGIFEQGAKSWCFSAGLGLTFTGLITVACSKR